MGVGGGGLQMTLMNVQNRFQKAWGVASCAIAWLYLFAFHHSSWIKSDNNICTVSLRNQSIRDVWQQIWDMKSAVVLVEITWEFEPRFADSDRGSNYMGLCFTPKIVQIEKAAVHLGYFGSEIFAGDLMVFEDPSTLCLILWKGCDWPELLEAPLSNDLIILQSHILLISNVIIPV